MAHIPRLRRQDGPVPTFLCRNRQEVIAALVKIREHMGISQIELDELAKFKEGYTGKLEQPDTPAVPGKRKPGRSAINPKFDSWIGSLGYGLVLVPLTEPQAVDRALPAPHRLPKVSLKTARRIRALAETQRFSRLQLCGKFGLSLGLISDIVENRVHQEPAQQEVA